MTRTPDMADLLTATRDAALDACHVAVLGRVTATAGGAVDVLPLVRRRVRQDDGTDRFDELPTIPSVPLAYPGGNGAAVAWTPAAGDLVLLVVCDDDPTDALAGAVVDPAFGERHALGGAIAVPFAAPSDVALAATVALSAKVDSALAEIRSLLAGWVPVPADGGAALSVLAKSLWPTSTTPPTPSVPTLDLVSVAGVTRAT
jgi:hypothetical protein